MLDAIVIGAGSAGLAAAEKLYKSQKKFVVIEARERIGGRVLTTPEGIELGAAWFHECPQNPLAELSESAGVDSIFDDDKVKIISGTNGSLIDPNDSVLSDFDKWRLSQDETSLKEAFDKFSANLPSDKALKLKEMTEIAQVPNGLTWEALSSHMQGGGGGRDRAVQGYINVLKTVIGPDVVDKIHLGEPATSINWGNDSVEVLTSKSTYQSRTAIITIPLGVLKKEKTLFKPELPSGLVNAINSASVAKLAKVYATFQNQWWNSDTLKWLIAGTEPGLVWNFSAVHPKGPANTLCVIVGNREAEAVESASDGGEAFNVVRPLLKLIGQCSEPVKVSTSNWITDPYSEGAYSSFGKGATRKDAVAAFKQGAPPLYFAGEHTTLEGATFVHGAVESGKLAAEQAIS